MSADYISNVLIPDLLDIILFFVTLFIAIRAFSVNARISNPRLLILGLAMSILALSALADFTSSNVTIITFNTDWFLYIGQAVSLLFILLSLSSNKDTYFQGLIRWQIIASVLLVALLLLSPALPPITNVILQTTLRATRCILCFGIFYFYISAFLKKQTRFSLLMGTGFLLLGFGYLIIAYEYYTPYTQIFDNIGDVVRLIGLTALLAAVLAG